MKVGDGRGPDLRRDGWSKAEGEARGGWQGQGTANRRRWQVTRRQHLSAFFSGGNGGPLSNLKHKVGLLGFHKHHGDRDFFLFHTSGRFSVKK